MKNALPKLNPLAEIALHRFCNELTRLEITREISAIVDCCNAILAYCEEGRR